MKLEYMNLFIEAAQSVTKMICDSDSKQGEIYRKNSPILVDEVVILIGVFGKIKGQVCFELSTETAKKISSSMLGGMPVEELDELSRSAVSELGNMIMGKAGILFGENNKNIDITPPTLLVGEKIEISNKVPTIGVPLELGEFGTITINVSAEEII